MKKENIPIILSALLAAFVVFAMGNSIRAAYRQSQYHCTTEHETLADGWKETR